MSQDTNQPITKTDFDFIRLKLAGASEKVHWIQLETDLRERICRALGSISIDQLAEEISYDKTRLEEFLKQKAELELLLKAIAEIQDRFRGNHYVHYGEQIRAKVSGYFDLIPVNRLAKFLGLARSTLDTWKKESEGKTDVVADSGGVTGDIGKSDLTQRLKIMLKRHEGKVCRRYSASEKELILQLVDAFGSKSVHEELKVSFDTIARLKRERGRSYPKIETAIKYAPVVETMKKYPGMGPMQVRDYVHRYNGISMGVNSVRKVMEDNGWVSSYSRRLKVGEEVRSYESIRRNHLWHVDFKHFFINKCKAYLLFIEDDHSRFITGHAFADGERVETVIEALQESITRHGKPEIMMSDGGSAFHSWRGQSRFTQFLEDFGIDHYLSKTPKVNGKIESINQKFEKEVLNIKTFSSVQQLQEELICWIWFYNFRRPHQGLGGLQVPADRYYPGWSQAAAKESGSSTIVLDALTQIVQQLKAA
jgi:putative transposase